MGAEGGFGSAKPAGGRPEGGLPAFESEARPAGASKRIAGECPATGAFGMRALKWTIMKVCGVFARSLRRCGGALPSPLMGGK